MTETSWSLQAQLDAQPFGRLQWQVVGLCWLVNILDGFDLLAISFAAPTLAKTWQLDPRTLGIVFSSGLLGMTVGSLLLGPAADRIGRRRMIILATAVLGLSTLATAAATSVRPLAAAARHHRGGHRRPAAQPEHAGGRIHAGPATKPRHQLHAPGLPGRRHRRWLSGQSTHSVGRLGGGVPCRRPLHAGDPAGAAAGPARIAALPAQADQPRSRAAADKLAARLGIDLAAARRATGPGQHIERRGKYCAAAGWRPGSRCGPAFFWAT